MSPPSIKGLLAPPPSPGTCWLHGATALRAWNAMTTPAFVWPELTFRDMHSEFLEEAYSSASRMKSHLQRAFSFVVRKKGGCVVAFKEQVFLFPGMWGLMGTRWGLCGEKVALGQRLDALAWSPHLTLGPAHSSSLPGSVVTLELVRPMKPTA